MTFNPLRCRRKEYLNQCQLKINDSRGMLREKKIVLLLSISRDCVKREIAAMVAVLGKNSNKRKNIATRFE